MGEWKHRVQEVFTEGLIRCSSCGVTLAKTKNGIPHCRNSLREGKEREYVRDVQQRWGRLRGLRIEIRREL